MPWYYWLPPAYIILLSLEAYLKYRENGRFLVILIVISLISPWLAAYHPWWLFGLAIGWANSLHKVICPSYRLPPPHPMTLEEEFFSR